MRNYAFKWIMQRLTAVILIPLTFWFVYQCILISSYEYDQIRDFFFSKINTLLFFILIMLGVIAFIYVKSYSFLNLVSASVVVYVISSLSFNLHKAF